MPFVQTNWWSAEFPEEWQAEENDGIVTLTDPDNIGALDITALIKEAGQVAEAELDELARENFPSDVDSTAVTVGELSGQYVEYEEDDDAWREWILVLDGVLLYATYNCDVDDRGIDDAVVDQILTTIVIEDSEYFEAD